MSIHYLKHGFVLDAISVFPFRLIGPSWLSIFSLVKLTRILNVQSFIKKLNLSLRCKLSLKLLALVVSIFLIFHTFACIWSALKSSNWVAPYEWIDVSKANMEPGYKQAYFSSLLYAQMSSLAAGESGPMTSADLCMSVVFIILGAIINANAFAIMADLI